MKEVSFSFGRFNPPTTGHQLLINNLKKLPGAKLVFASHSSDKKKNPLSHKDKVKFMRKFFGRIVVDSPARTVFEIATALQKEGFTHVNMMVGSDRINEFEMLLNKYNGVKGRHGYYKFEQINIISAGERDPDSDDVSGMSASKMRMFAEKDDFESFKAGVPSRNKKDAELLFKAVKKGMGIIESTLPNYMIEDLITEGVYDPGVFKAVFLMGGAGAGKSTVVKELGLNALGLKVVNTDRAFENGLKKAGLSLDLRGADFTKVDPIRKKARDITAKNFDVYLDNRLGMIFDTTATDTTRIKKYKKLLDAIGYESKMIYVNVSLDNAQKRNESRPRKLPPEIVQSEWEKSQTNVKTFRSMFKKDFVEVMNDDDLDTLVKKANKLYSKLLTWTSAFPGNKTATKWREQQLLSKKT
jgi:predicted kinase